ETYFRRTFKGTTAELKQITVDFLEKSKEPPGPDRDEKPGYGPEVNEKQGHLPLRGAGPLFAVIVGLPAGGSIGFLALLFPALFGGLPSLMKRWLPLVTAIFTTSTIFTVYLLFLDNLKGTIWSQASAFWMSVAAVNLLCLLWAWRRSLRLASEPPIPARTERWTISLFSLAGLASLASYWLLVGADARGNKFQSLMTQTTHLGFPFLLIMSVGFWMGGLFLLGRQLTRRSETGAAFPSDAVILWSMTVAGLLVLLRGVGPAAPEGQELAGGEGSVGKRSYQRLFQVPGQADISSAPGVSGNRVFVSAIEGGFAERSGAVYCIDRDTREPAWKKPFTFDGKMKEAQASPVIADGRVYVGEGWQENDGCHMFCLDENTGELLWKFPTNSHTESTPCVTDGRVFFGAGDDGLYCLDAK